MGNLFCKPEKEDEENLRLEAEKRMKACVASTAPVVGPLVPAIVNKFYKDLFDKYPETKRLFSKRQQDQGLQQNAVGEAVIAAVVHIEDLSAMGERVQEIVHRHVALGVLPAHYSAVHECLMGAIAAIVPEEHLTEEVVKSWSEFVLLLAGVMIGEEEKLYKQNETRGWRGFKPLQLVRKDVVAKDVITFTFKTDGSVQFEPGQYLTLKVPVSTSECDEQTRHYTVTSAPGKDKLQCSVKRIAGGLVSQYLHDELQVGQTVSISIPMGVCTLDTSKPHVLLSAGIGITSSWAAYQALGKENVLVCAHMDRSEKHHSFRDRIPESIQFNKYKNSKERVKCSQFVKEALAHISGQALSKDKVAFRLCGPPEWMTEVAYSLETDHQISPQSINVEWFGSKQSLEQAKNKNTAAGCPLHI
jgi:nitric oxide dioxygenase